MEVEVVGGLQGTTTVCAQPGLHYRSKSTGGGAAEVTDLTFVCVLGGCCFIGEKEKVGGVASERKSSNNDFHAHVPVTRHN